MLRITLDRTEGETSELLKTEIISLSLKLFELSAGNRDGSNDRQINEISKKMEDIIMQCKERSEGK